MRVLLVQPNSAHHIGFEHMALTEPLGVETVAGALRDYEVRILDMRLNPALESELQDFQPQAVGVAVPFTTAVYRANSVLAAVKQYDPSVFTFVGGHHATLSPGDFLDGNAGAVVIGEGEQTVNELLQAVNSGSDLSAVAGIAFWKDGQAVATVPRYFLSDLDRTPKPHRDLTRDHHSQYFYKQMKPLAMVETARGCPYRCKFCSVWKFYQGKYRVRSAGRVVEELKEIETRNVFFSDDNFLHNVDRASEICQEIKKAGLKKTFGFQARSDTIAAHPGIIDEWKGIGLSWVLVGFESFNEDELKALNKKNTLEANEKAVQILRSHNIEVQGAFIVSPWYGRKEFKLLSDYIRRLKLFSPQITILTPLPGTDFFRDKWKELTTRDYELFDFLHAVLPTRIPLKDFYRQFCKLYRRVSVGNNIKAFLQQPFSYSFKDIAAGLKVVNNMLRAKTYLKDHYREGLSVKEAQYGTNRQD